MSETGNVRRFDCARAMDRVHRRLDGEPLDSPDARWLAKHLAVCTGCRRANVELQQIQTVLQSLGAESFPDTGLERVWEKTTRVPRRALWVDWRVAAAAVVLFSALFGLWQLRSPVPEVPLQTAVAGPSEQDLTRAAAEARLVLRITASAIHRTERAAVSEVLEKRLSPALQRIPIRWPRWSDTVSDKDTNGGDDV
jgi:hypothetical protein